MSFTKRLDLIYILWPVPVQVKSSSVTCERVGGLLKKDNSKKISPTPDPGRKMQHYLLEEKHVRVSQVLTDPTTPHFC